MCFEPTHDCCIQGISKCKHAFMAVVGIGENVVIVFLQMVLAIVAFIHILVVEGIEC